eukprot:5486254-Pyramimonas_sp.AAC.1
MGTLRLGAGRPREQLGEMQHRDRQAPLPMPGHRQGSPPTYGRLAGPSGRRRTSPRPTTPSHRGRLLSTAPKRA